MKSLTKSRLLEWPENVVYEIRKIHNLHQPGRLEEALDIIENWIRKQDHILKKDFDRGYLERVLIRSKGSVEKAKKQIDRLCTMKTLLPHFFATTNVKLELQPALDLGCLIPLPVLTKDFYRVIIIRYSDQPITEQAFTAFYQYALNALDYLYANDYCNGFITVEDFRKMNLWDVVTKINAVELQEFTAILLEGYSARIKAMHMLTESKAIEILIKIQQRFLSEKMAKRLIVHKNLDELHQAMPMEILPLDYGGKQKPLDEFVMDWQNELSSKEHVEYMKMTNKAGTNEKLRKTGKFNEEYMGMPGAFRNLSVD